LLSRFTRLRVLCLAPGCAPRRALPSFPTRRLFRSRSAARSARDTWPSQRLEGGTGLSGVHRTCPVRQRLQVCQRSASPIKERNRSEEHTSELQSRFDLVCRLLLEKKKKITSTTGQP